MKSIRLLLALWLSVLGWSCGSAKPPEVKIVNTVIQQAKPIKTQIEVVFVLDTTSSMSGLIEGAKLKIWAIANEIIKAKPTPELKIGLVAYRDIGDAYVTRVFDLSDDLDLVYKNLLSFRAEGGGDTPESVNRALDDVVTKIKWSTEKSPLRIIYLVGDSPPHLDYNDGLDYRKIAQASIKNDIIINTIRCGDNHETETIWKEIASLAEGAYMSVSQTGGMVAIDTPMDNELAELSRKLGDTAVGYGERKMLSADLKESYDKAAAAAPSVPAARAENMAGKDELNAWDLIDSIKNDRVKLEKLEDKDLPEEMRKMTPAERAKYLEQKGKERDEIKSKMNDLSKKRTDYIAQEMKKTGGDKDSFDSQLLKNLKEQAAKKGINF